MYKCRVISMAVVRGIGKRDYGTNHNGCGNWEIMRHCQWCSYFMTNLGCAWQRPKETTIDCCCPHTHMHAHAHAHTHTHTHTHANAHCGEHWQKKVLCYMTSVNQWTCTPCGKQNAWFTLSDFRWLVNILSLWRTDRECFTLSDFRWLVNMHSLWRTENASHSVTSGD